MNNFIPSSKVDKFIAVWKAGLLTSLRTHERNIVGNTAMAGFEIAKDPVASIADTIMSWKTGKRTMTTTLQGRGKGAVEGGKAAVDVVKLGFDPEDSISKFDINKVNWGDSKVGKFFQTYTEAVFRPLGAEDKVFFKSAYAGSLYDQAGAAARNAGKKGNKAWIQNLVNNPTDEMKAIALKDANYATFHDRNTLTNIAANIKRAAQKAPGVWGEGGKLITEVFMPFTGVPSSIAAKTVAYSPLGLGKGIIDAGKVVAGQVPELQRQAAQEIGRGVMGTGLYGLGAYLVSKGLMTGQPKDEAERQQWELEGKQANSVFINGKWRSINSVGPQALVLLAGAKYQQEMGEGGEGFGAFASGLAKDQLNQTFLAGVQQPLQAINDPSRYGKSYIGGQLSSLVPNIVKDTSKVFDTTARETDTGSMMGNIKTSVQSGIPVWRNQMTPEEIHLEI